MKNFQLKVKIISNKRLKDNYWHLEFESGVIARRASPGQFVNIRVSDGFEPLLRRPISIHRAGSQIEILYEVIGRGTQILSQRRPGEYLDVIGPLGNGFFFNSRTQELKNSRTIIVAGGMGVAPLVFLAEKLTKPRAQNLKPRTLVLIGAKTKAKVLCAKEFKEFGCEVKIATDDGSRGFKGRVTELLKQILLKNSKTKKLKNLIYACGPRLMLKATAEIARENKVSSQLSLEEHMACGIGACSGCVVSTKSGYKRVCKDGPVFSGEELIW